MISEQISEFLCSSVASPITIFEILQIAFKNFYTLVEQYTIIVLKTQGYIVLPIPELPTKEKCE
jgi:hypothetical protein